MHTGHIQHTCLQYVVPGVLLCGFCVPKMCVFVYLSPGVKRTFPHIPICGTEFPGVEQEAGAVLLVAFPGWSAPYRAPLVWAQHLVDGGAVLVSQSGRGCVTVLLGIWRKETGGGDTEGGGHCFTHVLSKLCLQLDCTSLIKPGKLYKAIHFLLQDGIMRSQVNIDTAQYPNTVP